MLEIHVECQSDERGLTPFRFGRPGSMRAVDEVVDRWPGDGYAYFKIRCQEEIYILRHDEASGHWRIHFFALGDGSGDVPA